MRRLRRFRQTVSAQCAALAESLIEQYTMILEEHTVKWQRADAASRNLEEEVQELKKQNNLLERALENANWNFSESQRLSQLGRSEETERHSADGGESVATELSINIPLRRGRTSRSASVVSSGSGATVGNLRSSGMMSSGADSQSMATVRGSSTAGERRIVIFADLSPECDDECALLYMLSDLNNNEIPATIELIVTDSDVRFRWMEHLFKEKFDMRGGWELSSEGTSFSMGCVLVNLYMLHSPQREEMVIKEFKSKAAFLDLAAPGQLRGASHSKVPKGPADLILMTAPVPGLDPAFFNRFTGVAAAYVVGTPGGVNCQQPSWSNLLFALHQLAPVVYLSPQFTRMVRFPKAYVEENPHWTWYMKRTIFDMALTCMARRPEIPSKFGDWGLVLRLNAANAKLNESWFHDVIGKQMEGVESCTAYIKSIVQSYVDRNSGEDRKVGGVAAELKLLGVHTKAALDDKGQPVSPEDLKILRKEYREHLFKAVYVCVTTTETLLFQNQANFSPKSGSGQFRTMQPRCGYSDPHESLATIYGVDEAINILLELPVQNLTPAYDMVGAICALSFLKTDSFDSLGVNLTEADSAIGHGLFTHTEEHCHGHKIMMVGEQSAEVIDSVVEVLKSHVENDPLLVIDDFWTNWRHTHLTDSTQEQNLAPFQEMISLAKSDDRAGTALRESSILQRLVVHPISNKHLVWALFSTAFILYDCIMVPLQVFEVREIQAVVWCLTIWWTLDIIKNFMIGYYDRGVIEMRPRKVALHYIRTWFFIDMTIVIADWLLLFASIDGSMVSMFRAVRVARLVRLLSMAKMDRIMTSIQENSNGVYITYAIKIFKMVFLIFAANHLVACAFYFIGSSNTEWSWLMRSQLELASSDMLYSTSLHWAFAHLLLGEIDVAPANTLERAFSTMIHLVGLVVFSSFVSSLTEFMARIAEAKSESNREDAQIRQYMEDHHIPVKLILQISNYRKHAKQNILRQKLPREQIEALQDLPQALSIRLSAEVYTPSILKHGFFSVYGKSSSTCLANATHQVMNEVCAQPGHDIFVKGQITKSVYISVSGPLHYTRGEWTTVPRPGTWISEPAMWLGGWRRRGTLAAHGRADLHVLDIAEFRNFLGVNFRFGQYACHYAELVARGVHHNKIRFTQLDDLDIDMEDRHELAIRAYEYTKESDSMDPTV